MLSESRLSCLIRETMGSNYCKISILANVISSMPASNDLLETVHIASKLFKSDRETTKHNSHIDNKV